MKEHNMTCITTFDLPSHWASALINDDLTGYDDSDLKAIEKFTEDMVNEYGQCWCLEVSENSDFMTRHDAKDYGVLACDVSQFVFDTRPRETVDK